MSGPVERVVHGAVHELKLARAPVNALNPPLCEALTESVADALQGGAQGIVVSGGPKVFSAGLDVPYLVSLGENRAQLTSAWGAFFDAARALAESPVPVVAAIRGHAPAGGCVLALCCDYRIMARAPDAEKSFQIGLNETQVGLAPPEGILQLLGRVVGAQRAERMLVSGTLVGAERALEIGLVDELLDIDQVLPRALAWLDALLALPRQPMLLTRALARRDLVAALQPARIGLEGFIGGWFAPDTQAGLRALIAKLGK
ncbi:MAG: enoyl-CoA hydratase/isomerase family protein [Luteimonas sp.]